MYIHAVYAEYTNVSFETDGSVLFIEVSSIQRCPYIERGSMTLLSQVLLCCLSSALLTTFLISSNISIHHYYRSSDCLSR